MMGGDSALDTYRRRIEMGYHIRYHNSDGFDHGICAVIVYCVSCWSLAKYIRTYRFANFSLGNFPLARRL